MTPRPPAGRAGPGAKSGAKPGATHEQIGRRERGERARRETLRGDDANETVIMYGWHTVTAALRNPARQIRKFLATENAARKLTEEGIVAKVAPEIVRPTAIAERLLPDAVHQGLYLETEPLTFPGVEKIPASGVVLVLDQITDPHNVGAIFRSAAAFGVTAIVTTQRHSPDATGALAKAASGALEHVPLVSVQNLARGLATELSICAEAPAGISTAAKTEMPMASMTAARDRRINAFISADRSRNRPAIVRSRAPGAAVAAGTATTSTTRDNSFLPAAAPDASRTGARDGRPSASCR